jgi:hypothetical protein
MASYQIRLQNGVRYICEVTSFRNSKGRPDNKKVIIGKLDENDNIILNKAYLEYLLINKIHIDKRIYEISLYLYERGKIKKIINMVEEDFDFGDEQFINIDYLRNAFNLDKKLHVTAINDEKQFSSQDIVTGKKLGFGNIFLLDELSKQIGLNQILSQTFHKLSDKITTLM